MLRAGDVFLHGIHALDSSGGFAGPLDVSVTNGVITGLGRNLKPVAGQPVIDGQGLWLLPGIFDGHLHTGLASYDALELMNTPISRRILETAQILKRTVEAGVTFVRDAGITDAGVRDAVADGLVPGPTLQVCVVAIGATGGHGDGFLAGPGRDCPVDYSLPDYPGRPPYLVDGPEEMRKAVRTVLRSGADWIKLLATGGVLSAGDGEFEPELTDEEIGVAVTEAGRRRKPVMVHALGGPAIASAVTAGARSIEHGVFLSEADAELMAARGCALVPTLAIYHRLAGQARAGNFAGLRASRALAVGEHLGESVAIARAAGVTIALGSDFGHRDDHGSNLEEIGLLHGAGLTLEEALLAATRAGAELCGVEHRLGRLEPGYEFDAVLLDADPSDLQTYTSCTSVTRVFKRGAAVVRHPRLELSRRSGVRRGGAVSDRSERTSARGLTPARSRQPRP